MIGVVTVLGLIATEVAASIDSIDDAYFLETFKDQGRWVKSTDAMYSGNNFIQFKDERLVLTSDSKRYGISAPLSKQTLPGEELVLQYELKLASPIECAGAYLKMLEGTPELETMKESSSYTVMFGPDKCGTTNKIHLILRFKNKKSGEYKEHHLKAPPAMKNDKLSHIYSFVLRPDNSFDIYVDQVSVKSGSLLDANDWEIPFNPSKEIDDPSDFKPADWVNDEFMDDPEASKPADWDENAPRQIDDMDAAMPSTWDVDAPLKIGDPSQKRPSDWNEEEDGPWEPSLIDNPKCPQCGPWTRPKKDNPAYKGPWHAPRIKNPAYKGVWAPRRIENIHYYEVTNPVAELLPIGAVAIEVWVHKPDGITFDNIVVGNDYEKIKAFGDATWKVNSDKEAVAAAEEAANAKEQARKAALENGGVMSQIQEYSQIVAEKFVEYPFLGLPLLLLFFYLMFAAIRGGERKKVQKAVAPSANKTPQAEAEKTISAEETGAASGKAKEETTDVEPPTNPPSPSLRKRPTKKE